ncbi:MAG: phosphoheptose isomerase [Acidobacteria bacterium]|nr:MAG: phosphoheptose isomerase [Acidobacteriota bacterium]
MPRNGTSPGKNYEQAKPQISCAEDYFACLTDALQSVPHARIDEISNVLLNAYEEARNIFVFGNGGSAALASHFACDLGKGATARGSHPKRFRAIALTDSIPMMTALRNLIEPGDVAFAISASGNSPNVLRALQTARDAGGYRVGLTGFQGGKMKKLCDLCLVVPSDNMQLIEDIHLSIAHALFTTIRQKLEDKLLAAEAKLALVVP